MKQIFAFMSTYCFSLFSVFYLFTLGIKKPSNRSLIKTIARHFGFDPDKVKVAIPTITIEEIVDSEVPIKIMETSKKDGNVTLFELVAINKIITKYQPENIFEIGTFDGRTTLNMISNCHETTHIHTLDLKKDLLNSHKLRLAKGDKIYIDKDASGTRFHGTKYEDRVTQLYGDSATFDYSPYTGKMDFVFIDGAHSYEYVHSDTANAITLLKKEGGVLLWHDYHHYEVATALHELKECKSEMKNIMLIDGTSIVFAHVIP